MQTNPSLLANKLSTTNVISMQFMLCLVTEYEHKSKTSDDNNKPVSLMPLGRQTLPV